MFKLEHQTQNNPFGFSKKTCFISIYHKIYFTKVYLELPNRIIQLNLINCKDKQKLVTQHLLTIYIKKHTVGITIVISFLMGKEARKLL